MSSSKSLITVYYEPSASMHVNATKHFPIFLRGDTDKFLSILRSTVSNPFDRRTLAKYVFSSSYRSYLKQFKGIRVLPFTEFSLPTHQDMTLEDALRKAGRLRSFGEYIMESEFDSTLDLGWVEYNSDMSFEDKQRIYNFSQKELTEYARNHARTYWEWLKQNPLSFVLVQYPDDLFKSFGILVHFS